MITKMIKKMKKTILTWPSLWLQVFHKTGTTPWRLATGSPVKIWWPWESWWTVPMSTSCLMWRQGGERARSKGRWGTCCLKSFGKGSKGSTAPTAEPKKMVSWIGAGGWVPLASLMITVISSKSAGRVGSCALQWSPSTAAMRACPRPWSLRPLPRQWRATWNCRGALEKAHSMPGKGLWKRHHSPWYARLWKRHQPLCHDLWKRVPIHFWKRVCQCSFTPSFTTNKPLEKVFFVSLSETFGKGFLYSNSKPSPPVAWLHHK